MLYGTNIHSGVGEISCDLVVLRRTRSGIQPQIKRKRTPTTDEQHKNSDNEYNKCGVSSSSSVNNGNIYHVSSSRLIPSPNDSTLYSYPLSHGMMVSYVYDNCTLPTTTTIGRNTNWTFESSRRRRTCRHETLHNNLIMYM